MKFNSSVAEVGVRNVGQVKDHPRPCARCNDHETHNINRDTEPFRRPAARASTKNDHAHSPLLAQAVGPLTARAARPLSAPQTCCFATTRFANSRCFATRPLRGPGGASQLGWILPIGDYLYVRTMDMLCNSSQ